MRVALFVAALIFVSVPALTTPSRGSASCMSQSEARQHYGSVHLYWHGPNRCWDATPGRRRLARRATVTERQVERGSVHSDWRQAHSELLRDDGLPQKIAAPAVNRGASTNWQDRWIEIAQVMPRAEPERKSAVTLSTAAAEPEPNNMPHFVVILAFFAFLLIFATIEILFRNNDGQQR